MQSLELQTFPTMPAREPGTIASTGAKTRRRVLVVEDNIFVAHQCQCALTAAGYEVIGVVATGDEAVEQALQRRPDMVLMDIYLPGSRDGIEAAREIFQRCGIRCIYASAVSDAGMEARAALTHPLAWLPKPFSDRKLIATVNDALRELDGPNESVPNAWTPVASAEAVPGRQTSSAAARRGP